MSRRVHHDILFEPIAIGPVVAPNRFYQVPHCTGMGYAMPKTVAAMREVKAQGGWGVVNTEYCSIHPSSDDGAYATLWDEDDIRAQRLMAGAVHRRRWLVELWHGGIHTPNRFPVCRHYPSVENHNTHNTSRAERWISATFVT